MGLKKIKEILGLEGTEAEERFDEVIDNTVIEDVSEIGNEKEELKTEFIVHGNQEPKEENQEEVEGNEILNQEEISENQTIFVEPTTFEECKKIANYIKNDRIVMMNLENIDSASAQRIIDFVSGALNIKNGEIVKVSKRIYTAIPNGMSIIFDGKSKEENDPTRIEE